MTKKQYRSAMGKSVDLGALLLQNENVRAVGNMGVNARGDIIDGNNRVIDQKNRQTQRQYKKQSNVSRTPAAEGTLEVRQARQAKTQEPVAVIEDTYDDLPEDNDVVVEKAEPIVPVDVRGGLAAAIAKSREVNQELLKTPKQLAREAALKKI